MHLEQSLVNKYNVVYRHIQIIQMMVPVTMFKTNQQTNPNIIFKIFSVHSERINSQEPCCAVLSISYQFIFLAFFLTSLKSNITGPVNHFCLNVV